jgi:cell shape-determining protein MreC
LRTARSQAIALKQLLQPLAQFREELSQMEKEAPRLSPELDIERIGYERRERINDFFAEITSVREQALAKTRTLRCCTSRLVRR